MVLARNLIHIGASVRQEHSDFQDGQDERCGSQAEVRKGAAGSWGLEARAKKNYIEQEIGTSNRKLINISQRFEARIGTVIFISDLANSKSFQTNRAIAECSPCLGRGVWILHMHTLDVSQQSWTQSQYWRFVGSPCILTPKIINLQTTAVKLLPNCTVAFLDKAYGFVHQCLAVVFHLPTSF